MRLLRKVQTDIRGIAAVEFAILAPVMLFLTAATIEAGQLMMVRTTLEGAIGGAARAAMTHLAVSEEDRDVAMRAYVAQRMQHFRTVPGEEIAISTTVYRTFGSAYPEAYEDLNRNGQYDSTSADGAGEPFDDRNLNGTRDVAVPVEGTLGGPGDVVAYTAVFPARVYFRLLSNVFGDGRGGITIRASAVLRNEPVVRAARTS